ncbi:MAG: hypothetical protein AAF581_04860 [Planctomycetota bacterium]
MRNAGKYGILIGALVLSLFATSANAQYTLSVGNEEARPEESFAVPVNGYWVQPILGYSLSIATPQVVPATGLTVTIASTQVGAMNPEFFVSTVNPGEIVVALLFEFTPPFDGVTLGTFGGPTPIAHIEGTVPVNTPVQTIGFVPTDGLGVPPTLNLFSVENGTNAPIDVAPSTMTAGSLTILEPIPVPVFIRGDAHQNGAIDLGDPIFILTFLFGVFGGQTPPCLDAADANDDGFLNIGDPVYLLEFLFGGGSQPPEPFDVPGDDTTPDFHNLSCLSW